MHIQQQQLAGLSARRDEATGKASLLLSNINVDPSIDRVVLTRIECSVRVGAWTRDWVKVKASGHVWMQTWSLCLDLSPAWKLPAIAWKIAWPGMP